MRQVMPHRSNIYVRRTNCKIFFAARGSGGLGWLATGRFAASTELQGLRRFSIIIQNNGLCARPAAAVRADST